MAKSKISNDFLGTLLLGIFFSAFFIFTNIFDWDYVFTTLEVDLRSLVIDGKLPSWSYQMCGGSSRAGDPQSYGFSPLMILPILFGSFWGAKALLLVAVTTGIHYLKKIISLLSKDLNSTIVHLYIFSFLTSNFFVFHFSAGHLSFSSVFYAFPLFYICLRMVLGLSISSKEFICNTLFLFLLMSGGFYQSSIYFILPLALSFCLYIAFNFKRISHSDLVKVVVSSLLALVLSAYRWLPVLEYQKMFPRTLDSNEWHSLFHQFLYFILPIRPEGYLFSFRLPYYSAGEDSYFGAIVCASILLLICKYRTVFEYLKQMKPVTKFSFCLILVGVSFSLGNKYPFMPFSILNIPFSGSIRVPSRFNLMTYLGIFLLMIEILKVVSGSKRFLNSINILLVIISGLSFFQHYSRKHLEFSLFQLERISSIDPIYPEKMQMMHVTRMRDAKASFMYIPTLLGMAVPNCYQPMTRLIYFMGEKPGTVNKPHDLHFLFGGTESLPEACSNNSYFSQSELNIDQSCRPGTRLLLNFIEPAMLKKYNIKVTPQGYAL